MKIDYDPKKKKFILHADDKEDIEVKTLHCFFQNSADKSMRCTEFEINVITTKSWKR